MERIQLYLNPDRPLDQEELDEFRPLIKERKEGHPLQYITGQTSFMGLPLKIDDRALIPRPETEEMTERIVARFRDRRGLKALDLGTGSGAIAIALARFLVDPEITAVDKSPDALELARENAEKNDLADSLEFVKSDWFSEISETYDLIVSNPPYVASPEIKELKEEIKGHEPAGALNGGEGGLKEIKRLLREVEEYLKGGGTIFLEIGHDQGEAVQDIARKSRLKEVEIICDARGKDRIFQASKE